jgi:hypothetical protein
MRSRNISLHKLSTEKLIFYIPLYGKAIISAISYPY